MMTKRLAVTALMLGTVFLSACATTPRNADDASSNRSAVDQRYVAAVNRQARRTGTQVYWVNPPREKDRRKPQD